MFELFDEEKTRKTFRFDKPSIINIISNFSLRICFYVKLINFLLLMIVDLLTPFLKVRITKAKRRITPFDQLPFNFVGPEHSKLFGMWLEQTFCGWKCFEV
jgi:hypothetical protein